jgi:hypothetical protein
MIRFVLGAMACVAVAHADTITLTDALQRVAQDHPLARALALELEATRWRGRAEAAFAPMSVYLAPMISDGGSGEELIVQQPLELNGGQRARAALSHARYQLHRAEAQRALNDLLTQTAEAFVDAYAYQRRLEAVAHYVQTLDALQPQGAVHAPRETALAQASGVWRSAPPRALSAERAAAATAGRAACAAACAGSARHARCGRRRRRGRRPVSPVTGRATPDARAAAARCRAAGARGKVCGQLDAPCLRAGAGVPAD